MSAINPFPNSMFFWGKQNPSVILTKEQNADLVKTAKVPYKIIHEHLNWSSPAPHSKQRALKESSELGVDESIFRDKIDDVRGYWKTILSRVPPRPWVDKKRLIEHLATSKPLEMPSNSKPWKTVRLWIEAATRYGSMKNWADDIDFPIDPIDDGLWEAVRIIGDTDLGFGTFPNRLKGKLVEAGAAWILIDPKERIIPFSWRRWAKDNGIKCAGVKVAQ
ncbi:hypothetical protein GGR50DRAFT_702189 [Xylaria sp. CBS 124048]|nr:hypothetical protein GGR50DRAFT_702189 [Xylaria sp. CBS 124048]